MNALPEGADALNLGLYVTSALKGSGGVTPSGREPNGATLDDGSMNGSKRKVRPSARNTSPSRKNNDFALVAQGIEQRFPKP